MSHVQSRVLMAVPESESSNPWLVIGIGAVSPAFGRHTVCIGKQIGTFLIVVFDRTVQPVFQEGEVNTDVDSSGFLPTQVGVWAALYASRNAAYVHVVAVISCHVGSRVLGDVAADTVAEAQFEHIYPLYIVHELFMVDVPCRTYRPNGAFLVSRTGGEQVCLVPSDAAGHGVFAVVCIRRVAIK